MKNDANVKYLFLLITVLTLSVQSFRPQPQTSLLKDPAWKALAYLNEVRKNPAVYSKELGVNLKNVKASPALIWDDVLAKEAERKAMDMAGKNYFAHVDKQGYGMNYYVHKAGFSLPEEWLNHKKNNQIESLGANSEGPDYFIQQLIIDEGVANVGHRKHLLSMTEFYQQNTHIGIGIAYNPDSEYKYYCCILIAPKMK